MPIVNYYEVYQEGKLVAEGFMHEVLKKLPYSRSTLHKYANSNIECCGYIVKSYRYEEPVDWHNKDDAQRKAKKKLNKEELIDQEYKSVKEHLLMYGNTNVVSYLDDIITRLKCDGINVNVKHYSRQENKKIFKEAMADGTAQASEDWILSLN